MGRRLFYTWMSNAASSKYTVKLLFFFSVYAPYCGELNKNASGEADVAGAPTQVSTLQDCAAKCSASADCGAWYLEVGNTTADFTCYMKVRSENRIDSLIIFKVCKIVDILGTHPPKSNSPMSSLKLAE